ncbi:hypothetical protein ACLBUZ_32565, partial [Pseudomonas aeruginosa]
VALRVPTGSPDAVRLEHRVAGADANPYLLLAAVLAGVHHGLTNKVEPGAPIEGCCCWRRRASTWRACRTPS